MLSNRRRSHRRRPPPYRELFHLLGVDWLAAPGAWQVVFVYGTLGLLIAVATEFRRPPLTVLTYGLLYGFLLYTVKLLHIAGHLIAGRLSRAPISAVLLTATWHKNLYYQSQLGVSRWTRVFRVLGGPLVNVVVGVVVLGYWLLFSYTWLGVLAWGNLGAGLFTLLPLHGFDGGLIWRLALHPRD